MWNKYKAIQKSARNNINKVYWDYVNDILAPRMEDNPKIFWRFIKTLRTDNTGIPALRTDASCRGQCKEGRNPE